MAVAWRNGKRARERRGARTSLPAPKSSMLAPNKIRWGLTLIDVAIAVVAPFLAWAARNVFVGLHVIPNGFYFYAICTAVSTIVLLRISGVSAVAWRFFSFPDTLEAFFSIALGVVVSTVGAFFYDRLESLPRSLPFIHVLVQFLLYMGGRFVVRNVVSPQRSLRRKPTYVLLVGCNQVSYVYARAVEGVSNGSLKIIAALTHDPTMVGRRIRKINIISLFNNIEDVIGRFKIHGIDISRIIIAATEQEISPKALEKIFDVANRHGLAVVDIHLLFSEVAGPIGLEDDFDVDEITLRGAYWGIKRALDIFGASMLMLLLSPFFALTAALVARDVGRPLMFWQERPGRHGKMIRVFKFRTMKNAIGDDGVPVPDAQRTSRIGVALRKLRLDELPQLWNILKGDMSFIGPRPLLFVDQPEEISQRLAVRPGISGWAQINGGKLVTPEEKRALDLWYIAHVSFLLEMRIVFLTLVVMVRGDISRPDAVREAVAWLKVQEGSVALEEA